MNIGLDNDPKKPLKRDTLDSFKEISDEFETKFSEILKRLNENKKGSLGKVDSDQKKESIPQPDKAKEVR